MALRVLIVPDKFKGTLTAPEAAAAIARGWSESRPQDRLELLPMSDGGEGFGELLGSRLGAERRTCETTDAAGRPCRADWWAAPDARTAIFETAQVNGLARLPPGQYHPFQLDTFGIGAVLRDVEQSGLRRLILGLGGSATSDGGFGLARALGWIFRDGAGTEIRSWTDLDRLSAAEPPPHPLGFAQMVIAVDVANPLLGPQGATRVYGPQKGLRPEDLAQAEGCLARLAETLRPRLGPAAEQEPGVGAAGGLGYGLKAFAGGEFRPGAAIFAELAGLEEQIRQADLVITGEGALDEQSRMGKGTGFVAEMAARAGKRCLCLAGRIASSFRDFPPDGVVGVSNNFAARAVVPDVATEAESCARPAESLRRLAACVAAAQADQAERPNGSASRPCLQKPLDIGKARGPDQPRKPASS
jgi:glycerate kinase